MTRRDWFREAILGLVGLVVPAEAPSYEQLELTRVCVLRRRDGKLVSVYGIVKEDDPQRCYGTTLKRIG